MKNYGLCRKCFHEDFLYRYAKTRAKILSILPGRNKKLWKRNYEDIFDNYYRIGDHDNSLPENHFMNLRTIITADLVHREDIKELQNGIRHLLKTRRTNRFFNFHTDGLDEICNRLEKMDSTLLSWYEKVDCGIFEFKGHRLESTIDYFTVSICNIDSAYLVLEFSLYLTDEKKNELDKLIKCNYHEDRGYATSTLTARKNRIGSFQNYSVIHYNDDALKADKIYEFISRIEWEFYEALSHYFPFALHKRGIMPPRIETYAPYHQLFAISVILCEINKMNDSVPNPSVALRKMTESGLLDYIVEMAGNCLNMAMETAQDTVAADTGKLFVPQNWIKSKASLKDIRVAVKQMVASLKMLPDGKKVLARLNEGLAMNKEDFEARWTAD